MFMCVYINTHNINILHTYIYKIRINIYLKPAC